MNDMNEQSGNSGQLPPDAGSGGDVAGVIASVDLRFRSGGSIPFDCASIKIEEWEQVKHHLAARQPVGVQPVGYWFTDDPAKFAMPGSGFHPGAKPPVDAINVVPVYPRAPAAVPVDILGKLADALDCFWNPAVGAVQQASYHGPASGSDVVGAIAQGLSAVAERLRANHPQSAAAGGDA